MIMLDNLPLEILNAIGLFLSYEDLINFITLAKIFNESISKYDVNTYSSVFRKKENNVIYICLY